MNNIEYKRKELIKYQIYLFLELDFSFYEINNIINIIYTAKDEMINEIYLKLPKYKHTLNKLKLNDLEDFTNKWINKLN